MWLTLRSCGRARGSSAPAGDACADRANIAEAMTAHDHAMLRNLRMDQHGSNNQTKGTERRTCRVCTFDGCKRHTSLCRMTGMSSIDWLATRPRSRIRPMKAIEPAASSLPSLLECRTIDLSAFQAPYPFRSPFRTRSFARRKTSHHYVLKT